MVRQAIMRGAWNCGNWRSDGVGSSWVTGVLFADRFSKNMSRKCGPGIHVENCVVSTWCKNRDHVRRTPQRYLRPAARTPADSGRYRRLPHWHRARLLVPSGRDLDELRTAVSRAGCALPDLARSLRDLSRASCQPARWGRIAPLRRAGVPGLSGMWLARRWVRAISLWRLRPRPAGPFSCKGRALCPRCGGRRMAERAAHLLDHVFPDVPVRQWVLSLPYRMRLPAGVVSRRVLRGRCRVRPRRAQVSPLT
jgi:transposase-like zinc-binding protein